MKIAMMFPGYGSQYVGMGKEFYDESRLIQELFEQGSSCLDINFVKLCFASSDAELSEMRNAYTSTFLVSASIAALLKEKGIEPDVVAGFNHGVYAALFAVDGLSLPDGLYLLSKFAAFYKDALENNGVSAIHISGVNSEELEKMCKEASNENEKASIAIYETNTAHTVTGNALAVDRVRDAVSMLADQKEINVEQADLAVGLHSDLIDPVINQFKIYLNKVDFHDLAVPMIESVQGTELKKGKDVHEQILERINSPVVWPKVMNDLANYDIIVQIGPGKELAKWFSSAYPEKKVMAINKPDDVKSLELLLRQNEELPNKSSNE